MVRMMRLTTRLFVLCLLALPLSTTAQSNVPSCFMKSAADPSGKQSFNLTTQGKELKQFIEQGMLCPTACYDTALTLAFDSQLKVVATVKATNKCDSAQPTAELAKKLGRGCASGEVHPAASIKLSGTTLNNPKPPKDRCDVQAIQESAGGSGASKTLGLQNQLNTAISKVDTNTEAGRQQLSDILVKFGVPKSEADAKVADADKAADVQQQLQALVGSDQDAAKEAASTLGLKLNADLSDQARLDPEKYKSVLSDQEYQQAKAYVSESTGFNNPGGDISDLEKARCAISKNESGSCGGNYGLVGPPTRSGGRAYGRYQVMDFNVGPWSAQACGVRMTPEQFRQSPDCQDKVFDQQFGRYMEQCGFAGAAAKWFSGRCAIGSGGDGYTSIGRYVAKALGTYNGSSFPFGSQNSVYASAGGSPFAQVNPLGPTGPSQIACSQSGYCYAQAPSAYMTTAPIGTASGGVSGTTATTPVTTGTTPVSQVITPVGSNPSQASTTPAQPVATLIAQPQTVVHGTPFTVSWSSVGMRVDQMCRLLITPTSTPMLLAQQNDGSKTVTIENPGPVKVDMTCLGMNGQTVSKSVTVTVQ